MHVQVRLTTMIPSMALSCGFILPFIRATADARFKYLWHLSQCAIFTHSLAWLHLGHNYTINSSQSPGELIHVHQ